MKKKITFSLLQRMVEVSKKNFIKSTLFSFEIKKLVKDLRVFIIFNNRLKTTVGQADAITYLEAKKRDDIDKRYKRFLVDSSRKFLIIEINKELSQTQSEKEVFDTVSHELAHCVDFVIRGYKSRKKRYHDSYWRTLHKAMGGSGKTTY
jgi:predicted SprT family Zn-dependent metalloprotease